MQHLETTNGGWLPREFSGKCELAAQIRLIYQIVVDLAPLSCILGRIAQKNPQKMNFNSGIKFNPPDFSSLMRKEETKEWRGVVCHSEM